MSPAFEDGELFFEIPDTWLLGDDPHVSRCRSCDAPIVWATNSASGKRAPFDPVDRTASSVASFSATHFATCPDAAKWRKA